jgi:hypothetical protein
VQRGTNLYADGRYIEAAEVFERTEDRLPEMSAADQARYGLYRGLTLLVLGDQRGAHQWFSYAQDVERRHPGSLGAQRQSLLERGSYELGMRFRQTPAPPGLSTALAATPPVAPPPPAPPADVERDQPRGDTVEKRSLMP